MARQIRFPHSNTGDWVNPTYAYADDTNYATANTFVDYSHVSSNWYNFGFNIPAGSIINSVTINIKHKDNGGGTLVLYIHTYKGPTQVGDINARFQGTTTTEIVTTKTDNGTWTVQELNLNDDTGFIVNLDAYSAYFDVITYVNCIWVDVDYTPPRSKYFAQIV